MKFPVIFATALALCTLCSCNDIECYGDRWKTTNVLGVVYNERIYECKDGTRYKLECKLHDARDCSVFMTKDKLINNKAKKLKR